MKFHPAAVKYTALGESNEFTSDESKRSALGESNEFTQGESNGSYLNENMQSCTRLAVLHEAQMLLAF